MDEPIVPAEENLFGNSELDMSINNAPTNKSISVIICTLNNYDGLEKCVESICRQDLSPKEIIVVHGEQEGDVAQKVRQWLTGTTIDFKYVRTIRSLVVQRNIGIDHASGDVVVFLDDDVILMPRYFKNLLSVYESRWNARLGGVQGVIVENSTIEWWHPLEIVNRMFLLPSVTGKGVLLASANPSFRGDCREVEKVEVFSGCMMSFRGEVLRQHRFDENFREFWLFDDVELSYRISRHYDLYQTPLARLHHLSSSPSYEGHAKIAKMSAINRSYLFKKYFRHSYFNWFPFLWSSLGETLVNLLQSIKHLNFKPIKGLLEGWMLVYKKRVPYLQ